MMTILYVYSFLLLTGPDITDKDWPWDQDAGRIRQDAGGIQTPGADARGLQEPADL